MTFEDLDPALPEAALFFFPVTEADKVHFFFFNVRVNWVSISYV